MRQRLRFLTTTFGVLFLLAGLALPATATPAGPLYPTPDPDPFYQAPPDLANLRPGDVVRVRPIDASLYANSDGWQVAFRSTNSTGASSIPVRGPVGAPAAGSTA